MQVHLSSHAQLGLLLADETVTQVSPEYSDYANVFLFDYVIELPENIGMNEHIIKLIEGKQPPYEPIYILERLKLEMFKTYIETYLKTRFI